MIYAYFESILVPENNGKQNPEESYTNKYEKHVACSHEYKLVCFDDKLSKLFKSYLSDDTVFKFINSMAKESKYCTNKIKKHFNKKLMMTKEDDEDFENSTNSVYVHGMLM